MAALEVRAAGALWAPAVGCNCTVPLLLLKVATLLLSSFFLRRILLSSFFTPENSELSPPLLVLLPRFGFGSWGFGAAAPPWLSPVLSAVRIGSFPYFAHLGSCSLFFVEVRWGFDLAPIEGGILPALTWSCVEEGLLVLMVGVSWVHSACASSIGSYATFSIPRLCTLVSLGLRSGHCISVNLVWYSWLSGMIGFLSQCLRRACSVFLVDGFECHSHREYCCFLFFILLCIYVVPQEVSNCVDLIVSSTGRYCLVMLWVRINAR